MKKVLSRIIVVLTVLSLLLCLNVSALAESGTIVYKGQSDKFAFNPGSEYTATDLFTQSKSLMPGDSITEHLSFKNTASDCDRVVIYMKVLGHSQSNPLSENVAALTTLEENNAFLDRLTMLITDGKTKTFYSGKASGACSFVELGSFVKGEGTDIDVTVTVPADAGNEIAGEIGEIDLVFQAEAIDEGQLTVTKVWSDGNNAHSTDTVEVQLLRTKGTDTQADRTVMLSASNNWTYTFTGLNKDYEWSAKEVNVPEGYTAAYSVSGNTVTITNTNNQTGAQGLNISVTKKWSNGGRVHPTYVLVGLYNGNQLVEVKRLDESNSWYYHWEDSGSIGNWSVRETSIPANYYPTYTTADNTVVITNTYQLVQTGQLKWPVAVLGILGIALIAGGVITRRRKDET